MISIDNKKDTYILDLNEYTDGHIVLSVDSSIDGFSITWSISYVSDHSLNVYTFSSNKLAIDVDFEKIKEECFIILKNLRKEKLVIVVKPNIEKTREKNYVFKLGKTSVSGKTVTINVISKENNVHEPWSIVKDGKPLSYLISKTKTKLTIELLMILSSEFTSNFELMQDNSQKTIRFSLKHLDSNSVEFLEEKIS